MDPITAGHSVNLTSRTEVWPKSGETAGEKMCRRTAWRICSAGGWSGVISKNGRGRHRRAGPPVHDDLVERDFTAVGPNELWLTDITEHWTAEGKLYLCAIKDVYSGRIVGIRSTRECSLAWRSTH